jgi:hypothetical protein
MPVSRSRIESTLLDLVRTVSDEATSTDETAAVVRYVLQARRARFVDVPLVRALSQREEGPRDLPTIAVEGVADASATKARTPPVR